MGTVIHNPEALLVVDHVMLTYLKRLAADDPTGSARICLHHDPQAAVQDMVIAVTQEAVFPLHRHARKSQNVHVMEGALAVLFFAEDGTVERGVRLDADRPMCMRLTCEQWYTVVPRAPIAVYHEVTEGPFTGEKDTAAWAPTDRDTLREFLHAALVSAGLA